MIKINNFLVLISSLVFVVILRFDNSPNSNQFTFIVFWASLAAMLVFGSIYLFFRYKQRQDAEGKNEDSEF